MSKTYPSNTRAGQVYEVFAKFRKEEALRHVGNVIAPSPALAKTYAYTLYQEVTWSEMIAIPRSEVVSIIEAQ